MPDLAALTSALNAANDLNYRMTARPNSLSLVSNRALVKTLVLIDSTQPRAQPVQFLLPATHLLELDSVNHHLSGDFRALTKDELIRFNLEPLSSIPALPNWNELHCVVHESLCKQSNIILDGGPEQPLVELDQANFKNLVSHCPQIDIAQSIPNPQLDPSHDEQNIFDSVKKFTERRIRQRLDETLDLPPLPRSVERVIALRAKGEAEIDELVAIVESDPSLAAQVVSWAASPYYRAPGQIKSVRDAIVRVLGFDMVLNLALGLSLGRSLNLSQITKKELNSYWRNAMLLATTCESLSLGIPSEIRPGRGEVYLSGLLANLGYLILAEVFPLYFQQVKRHTQANMHLPSHVLERFVLGIDHNQIAAWLLENWQMPSSFVSAIRFANQWSYSGESNQHSKLILCARHLLAREKLAPNYGPNLADDMLDLLRIDSEFADGKLESIVQASQEFDQSIS